VPGLRLRAAMPSGRAAPARARPRPASFIPDESPAPFRRQTNGGLAAIGVGFVCA